MSVNLPNSSTSYVPPAQADRAGNNTAGASSSDMLPSPAASSIATDTTTLSREKRGLSNLRYVPPRIRHNAGRPAVRQRRPFSTLRPTTTALSFGGMPSPRPAGSSHHHAGQALNRPGPSRPVLAPLTPDPAPQLNMGVQHHVAPIGRPPIPCPLIHVPHRSGWRTCNLYPSVRLLLTPAVPAVQLPPTA